MGRKRLRSNHNNRYTRAMYKATFQDFRKLDDEQKKVVKAVSFTQMRDCLRKHMGIPAYDAHFFKFDFGAGFHLYHARRRSFTREFLRVLCGGKTPKGFNRHTRVRFSVEDDTAKADVEV